MTDQIAEAEVVPDEEPPVTQALVHQPRRGEVLRPLDTVQQREAMDIYQRGLREILDASDYQEAGWDKQRQQPRRFVKKSGWRKIAAWFDLSIELVRDAVDRDDDGNVARACVWARASAPSGRFADGDGYCDAHERRFTEADGRQKLENDLRGTATTRAINRAISNLVGMGEVSAEEMAHEPAVDPQRPLGPEYDHTVIGKMVGAACVRIARDKDLGIALFKAVAKDCGGYMPQAAALALIHAAEAGNRVPDVEAPEIT